MATAVSLAAQSKHGGSAFGFVRMWGTLGFLFSVVTVPLHLAGTRFRPPWLETWFPHDGLVWMFPVASFWSVLAVVAALWLPQAPRPCSSGRVAATPAGCCATYRSGACWCSSSSPTSACRDPINLFPLLITERGGDVDVVGHMWVYMLLLEIPLIGFSGPTLRRFGARTLLAVGLLAEGLRWSVSAWAPDLGVIRWFQLLHGVGVAGVIIGGPLYLEQAVPERLRSTGQTLVSTVGFGLGAIVSISAGGWLFEHFGSTVPYGLAGFGALALGLLVHRWLPEPSRPEEEPREGTD